MAKKKTNAEEEAKRLELIKRLVVIAMFSDDSLMDRLVLKGGNALDLIHRISTRASKDVDFSMEGDFSDEERRSIEKRMQELLQSTFQPEGFEVFDVKAEEVPKGLTPDMADFWGGYSVMFKVIESEKYKSLSGDIEALRKGALTLTRGGSSIFSIDISKYEYTEGKEPQQLSGYQIFVYSPEMMVCEKLRAICQQTEEYGPTVKRNRPGGARARDFLDIHTLVTERKIDMTLADNRNLLDAIFKAKRVDLTLLNLLEKYRDFHRQDFVAVKDTVKPGVEVKEFDFYFDFVKTLVAALGFPGEAGTES